MVKFLKIRDVKSPIRDLGNAGFDCFVPNFSEDFMNKLIEKNPDLLIDETGVVVDPGQAVLIPSGLKTAFADNIALEANNKSGVATKRMLVYGASVIDSSYQGEIHLHLINVGRASQKIVYGEKIMQFIPRIIDTDTHEVFDSSDIAEEEFFNGVKTARGEGGFGSTGTM